MNNVAYIRGTGDPDYNFGNADFTLEFFTLPRGAYSPQFPQTFFEISNNESPGAYSYTRTRLLATLEKNNCANVNVLSTIGIANVGPNSNTFTFTTVANIFTRVSYAGTLLDQDQYSISNGKTIILNDDIPLSNVQTFAELDSIVVNVQTSALEANVLHFIDLERTNGNLYLFVDGSLNGQTVPINIPLPAQVLYDTNNYSNSINRENGPSILTIGANQYGENPFYGKFGDFKIIKGTAVHVPTQSYDTITSSFSPNSGNTFSDITILGDGNSRKVPEELFPSGIYDTMLLNVTQVDTSGAPNSNVVLGYTLVKSSSEVGPIEEFSYNYMQNTPQAVPWSQFQSSDGSFSVNGNSIASNLWSISGSKATTSNTSIENGANVSIFYSGVSSYYASNPNAISQLSENLSIGDANIYVMDANVFAVPSINPTGVSKKGQLRIDNELITYTSVDNSNNALCGISRGVNMTSTANVYAIGTNVIDMGFDLQLESITGEDVGINIWYTPVTDTSLQNTNTRISNILLSYY